MVLIGYLFPNYVTLLLFLCFLPLLVWASLSPWRQPRAILYSSHQPDFVPGFEGSPDRFFALVYEKLRRDLTENQLPFESLGFGPRSLFSKRHIFSARCLYLEVRYRELSYYIYAVPAPGGLLVSSWLFSRHEAWRDHPVLKWLVLWRLAQMTLFQYDIMRLFHGVVDGALADVINDLRQEQGLRPLESYERRPVLRGFYAAMHTGAPISRSGRTEGSYVGGVGAGGNNANGPYAGGAYDDGGFLPLNQQVVRQGGPDVPLIQESLGQQPSAQDSPFGQDSPSVQDPLVQEQVPQQSMVESGVGSDEGTVVGTSKASSFVSPRLPLSGRKESSARVSGDFNDDLSEDDSGVQSHEETH